MCYSPLTILNQKTGKYGLVPCGKCLECVKSQQNQWQARLEEEMHACSGRSFFITLTYSDENVPKNYYWRDTIYSSAPHYSYDNTDEKLGRGGRHVKRQNPEQCLPGSPEKVVPLKWLENRKYGELTDEVKDALEEDIPVSINSLRMEDVRFALDWFRRSQKRSLRCFITGEYGPTTDRPHYHALFFNEDKETLLPFVEFWRKHFGFVDISEVKSDGGAASYVSKYASKGSFGNFLHSKDFFYMHADGTPSEYHSKHYEYCLKFFGIDEPMVEKPKKLVPRGLGSAYLTPEKIDYHIAKHDVKRIIKNKKYDFRNGRKTIALPKYYCEKLYNNYLKYKIQNEVQKSQDLLSQAEYEFIEYENPTWLPYEIVREYHTRLQEKNDYQRRSRIAADSLNRTYRNSKI